MIIPFALLLFSCAGPAREERAWANSSDGRTHAILIETNGGATTAFGYQVELHPADHQGQRPISAADFYHVVSDCGYGLGMHWADANTLVLSLRSASQMHVDSSVMVGGKNIQILVKTGVDDPTDPCRGMKGRPRQM